jgi:hypothetical protein
VWIVELNIAGYRVAREVPELTRASRRAIRSRRAPVHAARPEPGDSHAD